MTLEKACDELQAKGESGDPALRLGEEPEDEDEKAERHRQDSKGGQKRDAIGLHG
jgi:hypothetical protein